MKKEQEQKATFEFKLPPENGSMPILGKHGALNMPAEFNENLTKKEFNFYFIQNMEPLVRLTYGLIAEVEKLRKKVEEIELALHKK